jgi:Ca2+-binding RTX toxin-like protein
MSSTIRFGTSNGDTLVGATGIKTLRGMGGNDTLVGGAEAELLDGGAGIDLVSYATSGANLTVNLQAGTGSGGNAAGDVYGSIEDVETGSGNDSILGSGANNVLKGGAGADSINGGAGSDTISGGSENDTINGSDGNDDADGGAGADSMIGMSGNDTLYGMEGNDRLQGNDDNDSLDGGLGTDTLSGGSGDDVLFGGVGADPAILDGGDSLAGGSGNDLLDGADGNDTIDGGDDSDTAYGHTGNDQIRGGTGWDTLDGNDGDDTIQGLGTGNLFDLLTEGGNRIDGGAGADSLVGSVNTDTIFGGEGADIIVGGFGGDLIVGGPSCGPDDSGADVLSYAGSASAVNATLVENGSNSGGDAEYDTIVGIERLIGSQQNDVLEGVAGSTIDGANGDDLLFMRGVNSSVAGGSGTDVLNLIGQACVDGAVIDLQQQTVVVDGADSLTSGSVSISGIEAAEGTSGNDLMFGRSVGESLWGGGGADTIVGSAGADYLDGGAGDSDLLDYSGATTALYVNLKENQPGGAGLAADDTIWGFEAVQAGSEGDVLIGNEAANALNGNAGDDILEGGEGSDTLDGDGGFDFADYSNATSGIAVTLGGASGLGDTVSEGDVLFEIEGVIGSASGDTTSGDADDSVGVLFYGNEGNDSLTGGGGDDTLLGDVGEDTFGGSMGDDSVDGGDGADTVTYDNVQAVDRIVLSAGITISDGDGGPFVSAEAIIDKYDTDVCDPEAMDTLVGTDRAKNIERVVATDGGDDLIDAASVNQPEGAELAINLDLDEGTLGLGGMIGGQTLPGSLASYELQLIGFEDATGTAYADTLFGSTAGNELSGNGGEDTIRGREGNDTLDGGDGDDKVNGGDDDDSLIGSLGEDVLDGEDGYDTVTYADIDPEEVDRVVLSAVITSTSQPALILEIEKKFGAEGSLGHDDAWDVEKVVATSGSDDLVDASLIVLPDGVEISYNIDLEAGLASLGGETPEPFDTFQLAIEGFEDATGGAFADTLTGSCVDNVLNGKGGNDTVAAGAGSDTLYGDEGNDTLAGGADNDLIDGGNGIDTADYSSNTAGMLIDLRTNASLSGGDAENDTLVSIENITAGAGNDTLIGNEFDNLLFGLGGDDVLVGSAGNDSMEGGSDNDRVTYNYVGADNPDRIVMSASFVIAPSGNPIADAIIEKYEGTAPNDTLTGTDTVGSVETVQATSGSNDLVDGASVVQPNTAQFSFNLDLTAGTLKLGGQVLTPLPLIEPPVFVPVPVSSIPVLANYTLNVLDFEHATGTAYEDTLLGTSGGNNFAGNDGADSLDGRGGDDTLIGGAGSDRVKAGSGDDSLVGGLGNDTYEAAAGDDTLTYASVDEDGVDRVVLSADVSSLNPLSLVALVEKYDGDTLVGTDAAWDVEKVVGSAGEDDLVDASLLTQPPSFEIGFNIDLDEGLVTLGGTVGGQTLSGELAAYELAIESFEDATGGAFADTLTGSDLGNVLTGNDGDDILVGGEGADTLDGGDDVDTAVYSGSGSAVQVNLTSGTGTGGDAAGDSLSGVENVTGSAFGDSLMGSLAANVLLGGVGDDTLSGGGNATDDGGADTLDGGAGNDVFLVGSTGFAPTTKIDGGANSDVIRYTTTSATTLVLPAGVANVEEVRISDASGSTADTIGASLDADALTYGIRLVGNNGANTLIGSDSADTLVGNGGGDSLVGGEGSDWADYLGLPTTLPAAQPNSPQDGISIDLTSKQYLTDAGAAQDTLSGIENIRGSIYNDFIRGDELNNILDGGSASGAETTSNNDTLRGEGGADTFIGGLGADEMSGGEGTDWVDYSGAGLSGVTADMLGVVAGTGLAQGDQLFQIENVLGSIGADYLGGNSLNNLLLGGLANDTLIGNAGSDSLDGDVGSDSMVGGLGADSLSGGVGFDILNGGEGNDTLDGGADIDRVVYWSSTDAVLVDLGNTANNTGEAAGDVYINIEWLTGSNLNDTLRGNLLGNRLDGQSGDDRLEGDDGNDTLEGGNGLDTLVGGLGADSMIGGAGSDVFVFGTTNNVVHTGVGAGNRDVIVWNTGDVINLAAIDANANTGGDQGFAWIGGAAFSNVGQVRVFNEVVNGVNATRVQMNYQGDTTVDAEFVVLRPTNDTLTSSFFLL